MAEKERVWTDAETKLLLEIWSQNTIQRQLKADFRNVNVFAQVVEELRRSGYHRTVQQRRISARTVNSLSWSSYKATSCLLASLRRLLILVERCRRR